jgi:mRNA-degrading endonuclease YafQ of YafQ-DinJ toxin-antitoxin module
MTIHIVQTNLFKKAVKKLRSNQKRDLDDAVKAIAQNPNIGQHKTGDLTSVLVHKFMMVNQLTLIAYAYHEQSITLTLLAIGTHENFYRDLKKSL